MTEAEVGLFFLLLFGACGVAGIVYGVVMWRRHRSKKKKFRVQNPVRVPTDTVLDIKKYLTEIKGEVCEPCFYVEANLRVRGYAEMDWGSGMWDMSASLHIFIEEKDADDSWHCIYHYEGVDAPIASGVSSGEGATGDSTKLHKIQEACAWLKQYASDKALVSG